MPNLDAFVIISLATWRLSHLLVLEEGPWDMLLKLRERMGFIYLDGELISWPSGNPLACIWCTSFYVAGLFLGVYLLGGWPILLLLAIAAIPCLIESWRQKNG